MKKVRTIYRNIKYGIINIISWFSVIWNDRQWDHEYLYIILHKKLQHMEDFYRSNKAMAMGADKTADEIRVAKLLCQRLIEAKYLSNSLTEYDSKYGDDDKLMSFEKLPDGSSKVVFTKDEKQRKMFSDAGKHSDYLRKQDIDYLFDHMKKNIEGWWD